MEIKNGIKNQTASNFTKINIMIRNTHILLLTIALFCTISACVNKPQTKTSETMYCRYCGKQIPVDSKYCQYCGEQLNNDATPSSSSSKKQTQTSNSSSRESLSSSSTQSQVSRPTNSINGHEYVDLGLSVKWATCNVGASSPSDYGNYYAWGETSTKSSYTKENSVTYQKTMGSIAGNPKYDAARASWGSTWRLPTDKEIDELINKCKWSWTTQGGHKGYKITGPNGNSIFLPAAGLRYWTSLSDAGGHGYYWGATPNEDITYNASNLYFGSGNFYRGWVGRDFGHSIRPVTE